MANLHIEPSRNQLPLRKGPMSGDDHRVSQSQSVPGNYLYQLPPPRPSSALPFASNSHDRQTHRPESIHTIGVRARDPALPQNSGEKLPSVTQLLSPALPASLSPSPYLPRHCRSASSTSQTSTRAPALIPRSNGPYGQFPSQQAGKLPSISQFGIQSPPPIKDLDSPSGRSHLPNRNFFQSPEKSPTESSPFPAKGDKDGSPHAGSRRPAVLPHVVDERYIEGEGLCYIYVDGSYCPKSIDGEPVNANWGVTKAGKPRKRLAQACVTCREKKIKCQPNLPKCDQCHKSGKECRFESAPRGNQASTRSASYEPQPTEAKSSHIQPSHSTTPNSPHSSNMIYTLPRASGSSSSLTGPGSQSPVSERQFTPTSVPDTTQGAIMDWGKPYKRRRRGSVGSGDSSKSDVDFFKIRHSSDRADILMRVSEQDSNDALFRDWSSDPIEVDPEATCHYVDQYFAYVNDGIFQLLPKKPFLLWLKSCRTKSLDDKMLVYSVLALGSIFSDRPERVATGRRFFTTAKYALDRSQHRFTLQLAQSRIILSLWYSAIGALTNAWDFIGAAARTVCALRYNVEPDGPIISGGHQTCEYGLNPQAVVECRRRTFWAVFILDRFSAFYSLSPVNLPSDDIFLRLPCHEDIYEAQQNVPVPYFQNKMNCSVPLQSDRSTFGSMAILIEIVSLWGEVSSHICRSPHMPRESYGMSFEAFYASVMKKADNWTSSLPGHWTYNIANMENCIRSGRSDHFVSIHMLYHATLLRLNRHVRHENLHKTTVDSNIRRARYHATEILRMSLALSRFRHESGSRAPLEAVTPPRTMVATPFIDYAILSAADVLSAFGFAADMSECISLLNGGLGVIEDICRFWDVARPQSRLLRIRVNALTAAVKDTLAWKSQKLGFALDGHSMDAAVYSGSLEHNRNASSAGDLIYGLPLQRYFTALGMEEALIHGDNILLIKEARG